VRNRDEAWGPRRRSLRRRANARKCIGVSYRFRELIDPGDWCPIPFTRSSVAISRRLRRRSRNFISEKFSQPIFKAHFSGCVSLWLQPSFKILNVDFMPNLGLSDEYHNHRLAAAYAASPLVFAKHP
jgi:hypothetical protein